MITKIKDLDREILNRIDDQQLSQIWIINRNTYYNVCDDTFLKRRLDKYKNIEEYRKKENMKRFFCKIVYYTRKMREYNFQYKGGDFVKQYHILKYYKWEDLLLESIRNGEIDLVKHAIENESVYLFDSSIRLASEIGNLEILKYFVQRGIDYRTGQDYIWRAACGKGYLPILKWLVSYGIDVRIENNYALFWACKRGNLDCVKWLIEEHHQPIDERSLIAARENNHFHLLEYFDLKERENK